MESHKLTLARINRENSLDTWLAVKRSFRDAGFYQNSGEHNETICEKICATCNHHSELYYMCCCMGVRVSKTDANMLSYFESPGKRAASVRTRVKPGKFLKKVMPWIEDSKVESFVNDWKESNKTRDYELIHSREESAFIEAYSGKQIRGTTPNFSGSDYVLKELSCSCMAKDFRDLSKHPAAAYASGDFSILYAKEKDTGLIGARVVIGNDSAGPVYTQCNSATRAVSAWLKENDIETKAQWSGLSLKAIPTGYDGNDSYLMPYVDEYSDFSFDGDSITIGGNVDFSSTQGYCCFTPQVMCESCGDHYDESDMCDVLDSNGDETQVCCSCRNHDYSYSRLMQQYIHNSTSQVTSLGGNATESWFTDNDYVLDVDGYWSQESDCVEYQGKYYPFEHSDVTLFEGEYYHKDSEELIAAQEAKAKEKQAFQTVTVYQWQWVSEPGFRGPNVYLEYTETTEETLRINYQMENDNPVRLPELPGIDWDSDPVFA